MYSPRGTLKVLSVVCTELSLCHPLFERRGLLLISPYGTRCLTKFARRLRLYQDR